MSKSRSIRQAMQERGIPSGQTGSLNPRQELAEQQGIEYRASIVSPEQVAESSEVRERRQHMAYARQHPPQTRMALPWLDQFTASQSEQLRELEVRSVMAITESIRFGASPNIAAQMLMAQTGRVYRDQDAATKMWTEVAENLARTEKRNERKGRRKSYAERRGNFRLAVARVQADADVKRYRKGKSVVVPGPTPQPFRRRSGW